MTSNVAKEGNLRMKVKKCKIKIETTFTLQGTKLRYTTSNGLRRTINLQGSKIIDGGEDKCHFQIQTKMKTIELEAFNVEDKQDWIKALEEAHNTVAFQSYKSSKLPSSPPHAEPLATSLALFSRLDRDGDGILTFEDLRSAMCQQNHLMSESDIRATYSELVNSDGQITQTAFIEGLHNFYNSADRNSCISKSIMSKMNESVDFNSSGSEGEDEGRLSFNGSNVIMNRGRLRMQHSDSQTWAARSIYKGLKMTKSSLRQNFVLEEEEEEVDPEALSLAIILFQVLDVSSCGIITVDELREGLETIDPDIFSGEIMDDLVEQLDETQTSSVSQDEFTECFAVICGGVSASSIRERIVQWKIK